MLAILSMSGKSWAKAAALWVLFAVAVNAWAAAGDDAPYTHFMTASSASAQKVLSAVEQRLGAGSQQIARIEVQPLQLDALPVGAFGDAE